MNSESFWDHQIIRRLQLDVKCLLGDADRAGTDGEKGILTWIWSGCLDINGNIRFWEMRFPSPTDGAQYNITLKHRIDYRECLL